MRKIKLLRVAKDWSQMELSHRSGVPQYKISLLENGRYSPTQEESEKLGKALLGEGKSIDDFLEK